MNYYDARQRESDGRWDYTSANRRTGTHPVGYCAERTACECVLRSPAYGADPNCSVCGGDGRVLNPAYCGSHDTPDEARECFTRYLLDGSREEDYGDWTGCEVCDKPTKKGLTTRPPLGDGHPLCDEHRTIGQLRALTKPVGQITASY